MAHVAWYHAGSALALLVFLIGAAGLYFYLRAKNRYRKARISLEPRPLQDEEERVPLGQGGEAHEMGDYRGSRSPPTSGFKPHGNGFARNDYNDGDGHVVFELGDDDEHDEHGRDDENRQRG